jgi:class 3 adenylate cyclase
MDAVGVERAVLFGTNNGGPSSILFAATHPKRTRGLIVGHTAARYLGPERSAAIFEATARYASEAWGTAGSVTLPCPDAARDPAYVPWATRSQRLAISPREAGVFFAAEAFMDVRDALPLVRVPTLVLHREGFNSFVPLEQGQYIADAIDGARFALLPGRDAGLFMDPYDECLDELKAFLGSLRPAPDTGDRSLAAILFTDIVGSTARASQLGDLEWRRLLETHDAVARTTVEQHRGRFVKTTGDGILATFEGPGRAIQCGTALTEAIRPLGIEIRAAIHTGEIENRDADIAGIAVHIAARVLDRADAGELLVSGAVPMLVVGAGYHFEARGEHELKGVEGRWPLYAVTA